MYNYVLYCIRLYKHVCFGLFWHIFGQVCVTIFFVFFDFIVVLVGAVQEMYKRVPKFLATIDIH